MKKYVLGLCMIAFLTGCGQEQAKKSTPPQTAQTSQQLIAQGMADLQKQDVPRAIQSFDMAIRQNPTDVNNYLVLGQVYMRLKLYVRAIDTFSAATKVDPNSGEAQYMLATARALDGRMQTAITAAQRSVELFAQDKDEESLKRSVALLKGLTQAAEAATNGTATETATQ